MKIKRICHNEGKDFAGCGFEHCCIDCEEIKYCDISCTIINKLEEGKNPEDECKYCHEKELIPLKSKIAKLIKKMWRVK